jgi:salicylate hydroxylase
MLHAQIYAQSAPMTEQQLLIAGGGIGGLGMALACAQAGVRVHVLEQAPAFSEVGAGIQMSANAVKVLQAIGVEPALEATGVKPKAFEFRRFNTGELLHRISSKGIQ